MYNHDDHYCNVCGAEKKWLITSSYCPNEDRHDEIERERIAAIRNGVQLYLPPSEFEAKNTKFHPFIPNDVIAIQEFDFNMDQYTCMVLRCRNNSSIMGGWIYISRLDFESAFGPMANGNFKTTVVSEEMFGEAAQKHVKLT